MAEVVEYRLEKSIDELDLLVEFGLLEKEHAKEILSKRENYEYCLRRRTRTKLDYLKYIKFEINILESIETYKKSVLKQLHEIKSDDNLDELEHKILLLQAKKLKDVIDSRCAHISSLFRKLTTSFQFDKKLWLAYIEFAKSRKWYSRTTAIYWRLLRVASDDPEIWLAAASHEVETIKAYDVARGLYLRALRHHPRSAQVWAKYFEMEYKFMEIVDSRARIVFRIGEKMKEQKEQEEKEKEEDIWAEKDAEDGVKKSDDQAMSTEEEVPKATPIEEDDAIITGHLPKVIYDNAANSLTDKKDFQQFIILILSHILTVNLQTEGANNVKDYIINNLKERRESGDARLPEELLLACNNLEALVIFAETLNGENREGQQMQKKLKSAPLSKMNLLYKSYDDDGLEKTRELFDKLEKSVRNQTLSLYVGMIQVESWGLIKDKSSAQLNRIRALYDKALAKFGRCKSKLWYEYLQFEHDNAKTLDDFERVNQLYIRAQATLEPEKVDKVIEKYTLIQVRKSNADIEYSDYSDLEE